MNYQAILSRPYGTKKWGESVPGNIVPTDRKCGVIPVPGNELPGYPGVMNLLLMLSKS